MLADSKINKLDFNQKAVKKVKIWGVVLIKKNQPIFYYNLIYKRIREYTELELERC